MASELDPEAPEFFPLPDREMAATIEEGYKMMHSATRTCNTFPIDTSYNLFQTFTDFNIVVCKLRKNVLLQATQIVVLELPSATLRLDDNESNKEKVVDVNDCFLDRVNINVDTKTGENQPATTVVGGVQLAAWNRAPTLSTVKVSHGAVMLIGARNVPRPQLSFSKLADNSEEPFVPDLRDKHHALVPHELTLLCDEKGQPVGYEHPYTKELQAYTPPAWTLGALDEPAFPPPLDAAPLTMVRTQPELHALLRHLRTVSEIAVDLEHHSYRSYLGFTCLIQLTTDEGGDFVVDALALRDHLHVLNEPFTDPTKIKVFHGADSDVQWLQRDFGVYVVGLFDTHQAARLLNFQKLGLKDLLHTYCGLNIDKTHQLADWRMRPLPEELLQYARSDTHYLLYVWRRMRRDLLQHSAPLLQAAFDNSTRVASKTYVKPSLQSSLENMQVMVDHKHLTSAQRATMRAVWAWRDRHARALDESPGYLLPNYMLFKVADVLPRDLQGLRALFNPMPPFVNNHLQELHSIVLACREVPDEPQVLNMPATLRVMTTPPARTLLVFHHDASRDHPSAEESESVGAEPACSAGDPSVPDLGSFEVTAPWLTPQPSPSAACPPPPQKSQLNVNAQIFVPPFDRYKMYRVVSQEEEMKALKAREARVASQLARGPELVRDEVLTELRARGPPAPAPPAPAPSEEAPVFSSPTKREGNKAKATNTKRKKQERSDRPCKAVADSSPDTKTSDEGNKKTGKMRPFNYKKVNYDKFL